MSDFRCAADSADRQEEQIGSASTVRAFVLLEAPVRWGRDALREAPMPEPIRDRLREVARAGVKVLLIRRHGRSLPGSAARIFAAYADPASPWLETGLLESFDAIVDLDLAAVGRGETPGLTRSDQPVVCVCTHGRHDVCCAELGRPIAHALQDTHPDPTWEVSHIGGDRFAGNLLLLPHGLYYGRVTPELAAGLVSEYLAGRMELEHLRGRSSLPGAVQAAEWYLRRHLDERRLDALRVGSTHRDGDLRVVELTRAQETWRVVVRVSRRESARLTCHASQPSAAVAFEQLSLSLVTQ